MSFGAELDGATFAGEVKTGGGSGGEGGNIMG